jgi:hypothetical protein
VYGSNEEVGSSKNSEPLAAFSVKRSVPLLGSLLGNCMESEEVLYYSRI